jgi:hypothetical protein
MKCSNSGTMSSRRSRSGGSGIVTTLSRYSRSCRNVPCATSASMSPLAARRCARRWDRRIRAEPLQRALLQHAQQLHLQGQRHALDLVEEQRAARRMFELADAALARAGECPASWPNISLSNIAPARRRSSAR